MEIIAMSDVGNVRTINQDYVRYYQKSKQECLVVLCDGMGGHNAGEIASQLTCDDIIENYQKHDAFHSTEDIHRWMEEVINHAHQLVMEKSHTAEELEGMGTTVVIVLCIDDNIYISHVGDSRAYLFNNDELIQLTKDDTLVNVLIDSGTISKDEALYHPQKNILLQAVGVSEHLDVSFMTQKGNYQYILVCSDGLYNSLFDPQLIEILKKDKSLEEIGKELMDTANTFGGRDNIGFALILNKGVVENESDK
ncbi:Stp1/IreP family PP2C-type Ser/Thr phosphatase [Candidatus Stoquefichus massiliensis]|uniref:Stp1/IreP family PP2C-type Ser/Thr phosphatase n=1 Tax=Candidatus Stoquefichus massiliensis TaxID=1470350 RepID=UPI000484449B|nr:Stp1/IreP family PP2C-type Ser/Thr phosphatase [Candidatus Stoquefichus massiliensis]